jgi:hypothetical protein
MCGQFWGIDLLLIHDGRILLYVFGAVMLMGLILVLQKPILWIVLVAAAIAQAIRARREARVLETAFGDAYREYRSKMCFDRDTAPRAACRIRIPLTSPLPPPCAGGVSSISSIPCS